MIVRAEETKVTLRQLRKERGLTLEAVSVLAGPPDDGIDPATVSRIERGLVEPRPETIVKLARAFSMSARRMRHILAAGCNGACNGHGQ